MKKTSILLLSCLILTARLQAEAESEFPELEPIRAESEVLGAWDFFKDLSTGAHGFARDLQRSPRASNILSAELLEAYGIQSTAELTPLVPSITAPPRFGNAATPNIRGDVATNYLNGQRLSTNWQGFFYNFNRVDSVEIMRGPGTAIQGPAHQSGGYINYLTKSAGDEFATFELELGTWVPEGGSYSSWLGRFDMGTLLSKELAIRFSFEMQKDGTFFRSKGAENDHEDFFFNAVWSPSENAEVSINFNKLHRDAPQLLGVNRVTQDLIDDAIYVSGSVDNPFGVASGERVKIARDATLLSEGDFGAADVWLTQIIFKLKLSADVQFTSKNLFEDVSRKRYHQFEYLEYVEQATFETHNTFHLKFDKLPLENDAAIGFAFRNEKRTSYINFTNEYWNAFDITQNDPYDAAERYPEFYLEGFKGPDGRSFFGPQLGSTGAFFSTPQTSDSKLNNLGLFWQQELKILPSVSVLYGLRKDIYWAEAKNPLPPPNVAAWSDKETFSNTSLNASITFESSKNMHHYLSFSQLGALYGSFAGGGILLDSEGEISEDDFKNKSKLLELGGRYKFIDEKLRLGWTFFHQKRVRHDTRTGSSDILVKGLELEAFFRRSPKFYLLGNLSILKGNYINVAPFEVGGPQKEPDDYKIPGLPSWIANIGGAYQFSKKIQLGSWIQAWGSHNADVLSRLKIPTQFEWNARVSYKKDSWKFSMDFLNITNERNWIHTNDAFTDYVLIGQNLPFRVRASISYDF